MVNLAKIIDDLVSLAMRRINVMHLCRVISYNSSTKRADVQPLALRSNNSKRSMIQNVIVSKHCQSSMAKGIVVCVVFADRDLENFKDKFDFKIASRRMHSLNDAVIVGVIE